MELVIFMNKFFIKIIEFYQKHISKMLGSNCRHIPTCSQYAKEAYTKHRFLSATYLTTKRILKCNPFGSCGFDPVPEPKKKKINEN
jgi:uncharacterized protein